MSLIIKQLKLLNHDELMDFYYLFLVCSVTHMYRYIYMCILQCIISTIVYVVIQTTTNLFGYFVSDMFHFYPADPSLNFFIRVFHYITTDPWIGFIAIMCFFHFTWVYLLLVSQLFQVSISRK